MVTGCCLQTACCNTDFTALILIAILISVSEGGGAKVSSGSPRKYKKCLIVFEISNSVKQKAYQRNIHFIFTTKKEKE
jgi:hypothetical protein